MSHGEWLQSQNKMPKVEFKSVQNYVGSATQLHNFGCQSYKLLVFSGKQKYILIEELNNKTTKIPFISRKLASL